MKTRMGICAVDPPSTLLPSWHVAEMSKPPLGDVLPAAAAALAPRVVATAAAATTPPVVASPAASAAAAAASESSEQGQDHWEAAQGEYDAEDDGWDQVEVDDALRLA